MAKNTKEVTHYEIYTVRRLFKTMFGDKERDSMEEVAIFDDDALAEAYKSKCEASTFLPKGTISQTYEIQPRWVELEPASEHYNLPFNPEHVEPTPLKVEPKVASEAMVGTEIKPK